MTIEELTRKSGIAGEYADIKIYEYVDLQHPSLYTGGIKETEKVDMAALVRDYWLMDEREFNHTIMLKSCIGADFFEWYGKVDARVLVVVI